MRRNIPLVNGQYYHVFNRTNDRKPLFVNKKTCQRAVLTLDYYRYENPPMKLSYLLSLSPDRQQEIMINLKESHHELVDIIAWCLMPNHFHLLLRQNEDDGISKYLSQFENSITRYFNTVNNRKGYLFEGQFKAVRIETEEQLLHVHRYTHINPSTSYVVKTIDELLEYPWSSLPQYLGKRNGFCKTEMILSHFESKQSYLKFITDNIEYQRKLHMIKHLLIEEDEL